MTDRIQFYKVFFYPKAMIVPIIANKAIVTMVPNATVDFSKCINDITNSFFSKVENYL